MRRIEAARILGAVVMVGWSATVRADNALPAADPVAADVAAAADSSVSADSLDAGAAEADSIPAEPLWEPNANRAALRSFRIERSVDLETIAFGDAHDPVSPVGVHTLADILRLSPAVHTRELSQGPTAETFALDGLGSGRASLLYRDRSLAVPGTSAPHSHEIMLNEVESLTIVRGGAAALFGVGSEAGAVLVRPAQPIPPELLTRAVAEEGSDEYQRGAFQLARRLGNHGSLYLSTETRTIDGFFGGTKEADRSFAGTVQSRLPGGLEMAATYRRYEGDGRHGDPDVPLAVSTRRGDYHVELFRAHRGAGGTLLELDLLRERLQNHAGSAEESVREIVSPSGRITLDLPAWRGFESTVRVEATRWRIEWEDPGTVSHFWRGATAGRTTRTLGRGRRVTGTARLDQEEGRRGALQARLEGDWRVGSGTAFAIASRNERIPDRGAEGSDHEILHTGTAGVRWDTPSLRIRTAGFVTRVQNYRPEATFEEIRARESVRALGAPVGTALIQGGSLGLATEALELPGASWLGRLTLGTSGTLLQAENEDTGARLPNRPRFTWTGEGALERRFFRDELLARVRGRLTHWQDRVDEDGGAVEDLWLTDVLLEGEIGDAVFFVRFHDLLERADQIEPGVRLPGFSRMYGISWRFWG